MSADEKRTYGIGRTSGQLFEYRPDEGPFGSMIVVGVAFGDERVPGVRNSQGIAMKEGKDGRIYYAGYGENRGKIACYDPRTGQRTYLGRMSYRGHLIGAGPDNAGTAGAMCVTRDGTVVVCDFDQKQTWFNWFKPQKS